MNTSSHVRLNQTIELKREELVCLGEIVENFKKLQELYENKKLNLVPSKVFYNKLEIEKWEYAKNECEKMINLAVGILEEKE